MDISLEEAKRYEEAAKAVVAEKTAARREALAALGEARKALEATNATRVSARAMVDDLQGRQAREA